MKQLFSTGLLAVLLMTSCSLSQVGKALGNVGGRVPEGEIVEKSFTVSDFSSIESMSGVQVYYSQGPLSAVVARGPEDVVACATISEANGVLTVGLESGSNFRYQKESDYLRVFVTAPLVSNFRAYAGSLLMAPDSVDLRSVPKAGAEAYSGSTVCFNALKGELVKLQSNSGASVEIKNLECTTLDAESSSGSSITVSGRGADGNIGAGSGATLNAGTFVMERGSVHAVSGGSVICNVLDADLHSNSGGQIDNRANNQK